MDQECDLLVKCGFFKKYQATKDLACKGFIAQYCRGPKLADCQRLKYRGEHGVPPSDDMLPTGQMIAAPHA